MRWVSFGSLNSSANLSRKSGRQPAGVTERWVVDPDLPPLTTDRRKLRQVISNLVGNARKLDRKSVV